MAIHCLRGTAVDVGVSGRATPQDLLPVCPPVAVLVDLVRVATPQRRLALVGAQADGEGRAGGRTRGRLACRRCCCTCVLLLLRCGGVSLRKEEEAQGVGSSWAAASLPDVPHDVPNARNSRTGVRSMQTPGTDTSRLDHPPPRAPVQRTTTSTESVT